MAALKLFGKFNHFIFPYALTWLQKPSIFLCVKSNRGFRMACYVLFVQADVKFYWHFSATAGSLTGIVSNLSGRSTDGSWRMHLKIRVIDPNCRFADHFFLWLILTGMREYSAEKVQFMLSSFLFFSSLFIA